MGATLPAPHNGQCPMEDVPASLFPHGILPLINPFDLSLFEAQCLAVLQRTLKWDMKTLQPV